jgi:hypothetical protein
VIRVVVKKLKHEPELIKEARAAYIHVGVARGFGL